MRLWSLHPKYLDPKGLVALWREALLAQAVLLGHTRGYINHPQLERFKAHPSPRYAISVYLSAVHAEAVTRGYNFDPSKVGPVYDVELIDVSQGQIDYEHEHLLNKLAERSPPLFEQWRKLKQPELHPLFQQVPGPIASWERA